MNKNIAFIWMITLIILIWQASAEYNDLPNRLATSFDANGNARDYSSKDSFYIVWILSLALINSFVYWSRLIFKHAPMSTINVPNREYWFKSPEFREIIAVKMTNMFAIAFSILNIMMILVFEYIAGINIKGVPSIPFYVPLLFIPILILLPLIWVFQAFRIPEEKA